MTVTELHSYIAYAAVWICNAVVYFLALVRFYCQTKDRKKFRSYF